MATDRQRGEVLLAVFLVASAAMAEEILLVRLLALRFWPHFVPLVVSQAMLGFGAAGVILHLGRARLGPASGPALAWSALAAAASFDLAFRASQAIPLDPFLLLWDLRAWPALALFLAVLAVPFLLAGMATGLPLAFPRGPPGPVYAASFLGSAAGAAAAAVALSVVPSESLLRVPTALGLAAALFLVRDEARRLRPGLLAACAAVGLLLVFAPGPTPTPSPYKDLATLSRLPEARLLARRQGLHGDHRAITAPGIHTAPGLSLAFDGELPPQAVVLVDGEAAGVVPAAAGRPPDYLRFLPAALPYRLLDRPSVLQLGMRGTEGILAAAAGGAAKVTVVEPAAERVALVEEDLAAWSGAPPPLPVEIRIEEPRAFLAREARTFDLVELADVSSATFASLGVHAAGETYLLTRQGLAAALDRAGDRGLIAFSGWLKSPPRESAKLLRTLRLVLGERGLSVAERVMMVRGWGTFAVVARKAPFGAGERERALRFCQELGFTLVWPPDPAGAEPETSAAAADALVGPGTRGDRIFDLSPATDDSPYFHRFLRLSALGEFRRALGRSWIPFVEWGVVFQLLALPASLAVAAAALGWPLLRRRGAAAPLPALGYFAALGLGYMLIELVALKVGMLALGSTAGAATATLGGFTCLSGLGSGWSSRIRSPRALAWVCAGAGVLGWLGLLILEWNAARLLALAPPVRLALFLASLAPAAMLMGAPFPAGLDRLGRSAPESIASALAVNGFWSVAGASLASVGALWLGFRATAGAGAAVYLAAAFLARRLQRKVVA